MPPQKNRHWDLREHAKATCETNRHSLWFPSLTLAQRSFQHGEVRFVLLDVLPVRQSTGTALRRRKKTAQASHAAKKPGTCMSAHSLVTCSKLLSNASATCATTRGDTPLVPIVVPARRGRSVLPSNKGVPMFCPFAERQEAENTAQASHAAKSQGACLVLRSGRERQHRCVSNGTERHASKSARKLLRIDHQVFGLSSGRK